MNEKQLLETVQHKIWLAFFYYVELVIYIIMEWDRKIASAIKILRTVLSDSSSNYY